MHRAVLAVLATVLLLPAAQAAATGGRAPITVDSTVSEVAMAGNGRFVAVGADPGDGIGGNPDDPSWNLWNVDGSLRQQGSAHPPSCDSGQTPSPPLEDCKTDATHVAISDDGKLLVISSVIDTQNDALLSFYNDAGVRSNAIFYDGGSGHGRKGTITDVAISADGSRSAVALSIPPAQAGGQPTGLVQVFDGHGASIGMFSGDGQAYGKPATAVALSPDGSRLDVAAGAHYRYSVGSPTGVTHNLSGATANDVDTATGGWSVAGFSTGFFALYDSHIDAANPYYYQKKEAGETTGLSAVAMRRDGSAFATGSAGGTLHYYSLDPNAATDQVVLRASKTGLGNVASAAFSADGRYLAVRSGTDSVRLYRATATGLDELWKDTHAGLGPGLGIDTRGDHVVAHTSDATHAVLVYDAVHKLAALVPAATQQSGTTANATVTYRNDGNRAEDVTVTAATPPGVTVTLTPSQFTVPVGSVQAVTVTTALATTVAPGTATVTLTHQMGGGQDGTGTAKLAITVPTTHDLRLDVSGASSLGVAPGGTAAFQVVASNAGNVRESGALSVTGLPSGWTANVDPTSLDLAPGASTGVTVGLTPPATAPHLAQADVRLGCACGGSLELVATVGAGFGVSLQAPGGLILAPGVSGLLNLTVKNTGNAPDTVVLHLGNLPEGWEASFVSGLGEERRDLDPGQSATVQATVRPPGDAEPSSVPVQFAVHAESLGDATKTAARALLLTIEAPQESSSSSSAAAHHKSPDAGPLALVGLVALAVAARRRRA